MKDERLFLALQNKKVAFHRPSEPESWFNILIVHQNRYKGHNVRVKQRYTMLYNTIQFYIMLYTNLLFLILTLLDRKKQEKLFTRQLNS